MNLRDALEKWFEDHAHRFDTMAWQHSDFAVELIDYIAPYFEKGEAPMPAAPSTIALTAKQIYFLFVIHDQEDGIAIKSDSDLEYLRDLSLVTLGDGRWKVTDLGRETANHFMGEFPG